MPSTRSYPQMAATPRQIEPAPRRIRGFRGDRLVFDTTRAVYFWEAPFYPQYAIPLADIDDTQLVDEDQQERRPEGLAQRYGLRAGDDVISGAVRVYTDDALEGLHNTARFDWAALTAWFEEDEQIFVHPRNPYVRVDALRSNRGIRVELEGVVLAEATTSVMVFETGLPTRYYLDQTTLNHAVLLDSKTQSECPYKGTTSAYWSARIGDRVEPDVAWGYDFPTRELLPIAGLVSFYNEKLDIFLDGELLERPETLRS